MVLLDLLLGADFTPLGLQPGWVVTEWLFLIGVARLLGGMAATTALTLISWRSGGRMRTALIVILVVSVVTVVEAVAGLAEWGCFFNSETPWDCSVGD